MPFSIFRSHAVILKRIFRISVVSLLLIIGALSTLTAQDSGKLSPAEARKIIADGNIAWGKARVALDRQVFETMLAPDFYVQLPDRKLSRQEFIDFISTPHPGMKLT